MPKLGTVGKVCGKCRVKYTKITVLLRKYRLFVASTYLDEVDLVTAVILGTGHTGATHEEERHANDPNQQNTMKELPSMTEKKRQMTKEKRNGTQIKTNSTYLA